jgi:hypothetical protein
MLFFIRQIFCNLAKIAAINHERLEHGKLDFLIVARAPHVVEIPVVARCVLDPARQPCCRRLYRRLYGNFIHESFRHLCLFPTMQDPQYVCRVFKAYCTANADVHRPRRW